MIYAYWTAGARDAHEGQTVFSGPDGGTRIGERIAAPGVHLSQRPGVRRPGLRPVQRGAVLVRHHQRLRQRPAARAAPTGSADGELTSLVQTRHTAEHDRPAGDAGRRQPRARGRRRRAATIADLVAGTERGLLLTCLWYIREVDPQTLLLTGLTRDGVYLVENGEITGAVNNFRFNESPVDLLGRFTHASATVPELHPRVGRRLLLPHRDAGAAGPRLQHVERLPGPVSDADSSDDSSPPPR